MAPCRAQQNDTESTTITIAPLSLADFFDGASFRPGVEIPIGRQMAIGLEGGIYLPYLNSTKIKPHGWLVRPSLKYYFKTTRQGKYVAAEYFFKDQDYNYKDLLEFDGARFEKHYAMKRQVHALAFRYGKVRKLGKQFTIDYYAGIGVRHIISDSDLTPEESDAILSGAEGDCPLQQDILRITGNHWYPNLLFGLRIGYRM